MTRQCSGPGKGEKHKNIAQKFVKNVTCHYFVTFGDTVSYHPPTQECHVLFEWPLDTKAVTLNHKVKLQRKCWQTEQRRMHHIISTLQQLIVEIVACIIDILEPFCINVIMSAVVF